MISFYTKMRKIDIKDSKYRYMIRKSSAMESKQMESSQMKLLDLPPEILTIIVSYTANKSAIACVCFNIEAYMRFIILSVKDAVINNDYYSLSRYPFMSNVIAFYAARHGNVGVLERFFPTDSLNQREIMYELGRGCLSFKENNKLFSNCNQEMRKECDFMRGKISVGKIPDTFSTYMIEKLFEEFDFGFARLLTQKQNDSIDIYYKKIGIIANKATPLREVEIIYNKFSPSERINPRTITAFARRREVLEPVLEHLHVVCPLVWREQIRGNYLDVIELMITKNPYTHQIKEVVSSLIEYCCEWEKYDLIDKIREIIERKMGDL
jgi:hypothetical protein